MARSTKTPFELPTGDSADSMLRIEFLTQSSGVLGELHEAMPGSTIALNSVLPIDETEWLAFLTASSTSSPPATVVEQTPGIELLYHQAYGPDSTTYQLIVIIEDDHVCLVQTLARQHAIPHSLSLSDQTLNGLVTVREWDHLQSLAEQIKSVHNKFELLSVTQVDHVGSLLGTDRFTETIRNQLTEAQLQTLETAHQLGYFTVPQTVTASDVADELAVSQSTVSERLRRAMGNLLIIAFGETREAPTQQL